MSTLTLPFFIGSSSFLQVTRTAIKACMCSKLGKIGPGTSEKATLERLAKKKILKWEKCCEHSSAFIFEWIFIILTVNKDNYKSLKELEFLSDPITNY